jgi:hypothetical protein
MFAETVGKSDKKGNLQMRIALLFMNGFESGLKCWNQWNKALSIIEVRMTFKVKVIQGQTLRFQPKCPGMQGLSVWSLQMTFVARGSRNMIQNTDSDHERVNVQTSVVAKQ